MALDEAVRELKRLSHEAVYLLEALQKMVEIIAHMDTPERIAEYGET